MKDDKGLSCPICHSTNHIVKDVRESSFSIRRRRECRNCGKLFTTFEFYKRDGISIKRVIKQLGLDRRY